MHQPSELNRPWFQTIFAGAPPSIAACARAFQIDSISTSPLCSSWVDCAPLVHQTLTSLRSLSRLRNARSTSRG
jgi:hypothetical protein